MTCMCCGHASIFHGPHGCTAGESSIDPCKCPGYEAPLGEGREAPSPSGFTPLARELDRVAAAMPDIEACARAAYHAQFSDSGAIVTPWVAQSGVVREKYREVARAVLAAARGGR